MKIFRLFAIVICLGAILGACTSSSNEETIIQDNGQAISAESSALCDDGICGGPEDSENCPQDCQASEESKDAQSTQPLAPTAVPVTLDGPGYISFVINVHDFVNLSDSAAILLRLIDLFESKGLSADIYLTGPMTQLYTEQHPEVITRLRDSKMAISYHVRPPHPLYAGFDQPLEEIEDNSANADRELGAFLRDYESYRLDLSNGEVLLDEIGGYSFVAQTLGRNPIVASSPNEHWRDAALPIYHALGALMTITYHETGTDPEQPFEWVDGLLVRPSDFSITRWADPERPEKVAFWWTMLDTPGADAYNPTKHLQEQMAAWDGDRPPFITVLIHENNFYRRDGTPFTYIFWADKNKSETLSAPYDLNAEDASRARSFSNAEEVWAAYAALVEYAAANLNVLSSDEIVELAESGK